MELQINDKTKALAQKLDIKLNKKRSYESNDLQGHLNTLFKTGSVEVGYRACCGTTHHTQFVFREWVKIIKAIEKDGIAIKKDPVTHKNAYATINGGFWQSTVYSIVLI